MLYPEWVEKYRQKGTNISCIRGKYYLYACTSKYDPEKKRAKKITGEYLGRITEDGLIPPKRKQQEAQLQKVSIKEYGARKAVSMLGTDIYSALKKHFPKDADRIFAISALRLIEKCPFKRIGEAYFCLSERRNTASGHDSVYCVTACFARNCFGVPA